MKKKKVLLFGCNALVNEVAGQLDSRGIEFIIISQDKDCLKKLDANKKNVKRIDYTDDEQLKAIGIGTNVDTIFSFFEEDAKNVYLIISAKYINPDLLIITLSQSPDSAEKLQAAGADKVIDPYKFSGRKIVNMIKRPLISETIEHVIFGQSSINMAEIVINQQSFLNGLLLQDAQLSIHYNLILLGIVDRQSGNEFTFKLSNIHYKIKAGDLLVVIGSSDDIEHLKADIS